MQFPNEARFGNFITRVNAILQGYSAFRHGGNCRFVDNDHHAVIAVYRQESEVNATGFLIVCNFDIQASQDISIDPGSFAGSGRPVSCTDLLSGETLTFKDSVFKFNLPPCFALVLKFETHKH